MYEYISHEETTFICPVLTQNYSWIISTEKWCSYNCPTQRLPSQPNPIHPTREAQSSYSSRAKKRTDSARGNAGNEYEDKIGTKIIIFSEKKTFAEQ